jgi:hypothetical protein
VEEWERQVVDIAKVVLSDDPEVRAKAGKQLCPGLREEKCQHTEAKNSVL